MIRRVSVAPLTSRLRTPNRSPNTSVFLNEKPTDANNMNENNKNLTEECHKANIKKESEQNILNKEEEQNHLDYDYPKYVRSIKERECWKLYQKMSNKGVNVTYDTILRGMLTPTEFRQLQKQRDLEEARIRESEEAAAAEALANAPTKSSSAIERLSEALLKKS